MHSSRPIRRAFTLIELLVVIGIIGVLLAILLPSLSAARASATRIKCMSNLHQLLSAEMTYVSESHGYLTYPNWANDHFSTDVWPTGWLYTQGKVSVPLEQDDVKEGALFPYLQTTRVYHCPAHLSDDWSPNGTDRLTSYMMNGAVCGYGAVGHKADDGSTTAWAPSWKITDWTHTSEQILWWEADEGNPQTADAAWNDGSSKPYENQLAHRHGRGASVGFFDSHVEWMDRVDYLVEMQQPGPNRLWCDPHQPDGGQGSASNP